LKKKTVSTLLGTQLSSTSSAEITRKGMTVFLPHVVIKEI
jgi:hypothetical protein